MSQPADRFLVMRIYGAGMFDVVFDCGCTIKLLAGESLHADDTRICEHAAPLYLDAARRFGEVNG